MDPLIIGFQPPCNASLGDVHRDLASAFETSAGTVVGHWSGDSADYVVIADPPPVAELEALAVHVSADLTGIARLVVDAGDADDVRGVEQVLVQDPGTDISLPSPTPYIDAEKLVCPVCGGIDNHFSPPH